MPVLVNIASAILVAYIAVTLCIALMQPRYIYHPARAIFATPETIGLAYESLVLKTADGESIHAWYVPHNSVPGKTARTILFCHGNGGNMGNRVGSLLTFNQLGFNTLTFDYRGYGESSGKPSEAGTYRDAKACWDYLINQCGLQPSDIILYGRSLGGAIASHLAVDVNPAALVLESVFASIPDMATEMFPILPIAFFCRYKYDNARNVAKVSCPVLVAHSQEDQTCPFSQARHVFDAASDPKQFVEMEGGHNGGGLDSNPHFQDLLMVFLEKCLTTTSE